MRRRNRHERYVSVSWETAARMDEAAKERGITKSKLVELACSKAGLAEWQDRHGNINKEK